MKLPTPDQIEAAARQRGWSIAGLCRRADLDATAFHRWKSGESKPTLRTIEKMLDAIGQEEDR